MTTKKNTKKKKEPKYIEKNLSTEESRTILKNIHHDGVLEETVEALLKKTKRLNGCDEMPKTKDFLDAMRIIKRPSLCKGIYSRIFRELKNDGSFEWKSDGVSHAVSHLVELMVDVPEYKDRIFKDLMSFNLPPGDLCYMVRKIPGLAHKEQAAQKILDHPKKADSHLNVVMKFVPKLIPKAASLLKV